MSTDERDILIYELTASGLSARKVQQRLGQPLTVRQVQRIAASFYGRTDKSQVFKSAEYQITPGRFRDAVVSCLERLGKDPFFCENCQEPQEKKCDIHHTKYEGATIYDLRYVCRSCNLSRVNKGLA